KMGVVGFTYSCANALARYGVTVNAISPGANTRMTAAIPDERRRTARSDDLTPDNMAPTVAWLASPRSAWCNGQVLHVRGLEVGLYDRPRVIERIRAERPWGHDELAEAAERAFRRLLAPQDAPAPASS